MTPAETSAKMQHLVALIAQFEKHIKNDSPMEEVLPTVFASHSEYYKGYTIRQLCQKMHDFYARNNIKELQREMFRKEYFPKQALTPFEAQHEFIHNNVSLVALKDIEGKIAAEGALPYPPGILCCVPGEVWGGPVLKYFLALEEGINVLPGFEPEIQGVYLEEKDGHITAYGYVIDKQ